ncbi:MAG TPA: DUF2071 domain-containing protein [Thermoanaerobaculia bacterium]|jgi:hypothetical protein|nr:DUF2071 domain-containing protein [Thermoanaerobaculia bacterium]
MKIETQLRDGLVLNWALPKEILPALPPTLSYQVHADDGHDRVFASAFLFHHERVHWPALPGLRFSWPQMNLRLCVLDEEGVPSALIRRIFLPAWAYPGARLFAGPPVAVAHLDFPRPSNRLEAGEWRWRATRGVQLEVSAKPASPEVGVGPRLGSWERTVQYVHDRPRGYCLFPGGLRRTDVNHPPVASWPVRAEIHQADLFAACFGLAPTALPPLHSAWICPEIRLSFELALTPRLAVPQRVPHPAASRAALCGRHAAFPPRPAA